MGLAKVISGAPEVIHYYDKARQHKWVIPILCYDEAMLAIDKPAGLPVIPERWHPEWPCAQSVLYERLREKPLIVHRLDAGTTGVVVFARSADSHKKLSEQFANHEVEKTYLAVVRGEIIADEQMVELAVAPHPTHGGEMIIAKNGKPAMTQVRVIERFRGYTLVEARPQTGRQHQIRVHLQAIGHPLIVDAIYGRHEAFFLSFIKSRMHFGNDEDERALMSRLSLHAVSLKIRHPLSGEIQALTAPLPKDFQAVLKALRKYAT